MIAVLLMLNLRAQEEVPEFSLVGICEGKDIPSSYYTLHAKHDGQSIHPDLLYACFRVTNTTKNHDVLIHHDRFRLSTSHLTEDEILNADGRGGCAMAYVLLRLQSVVMRPGESLCFFTECTDEVFTTPSVSLLGTYSLEGENGGTRQLNQPLKDIRKITFPDADFGLIKVDIRREKDPHSAPEVPFYALTLRCDSDSAGYFLCNRQYGCRAIAMIFQLREGRLSYLGTFGSQSSKKGDVFHASLLPGDCHITKPELISVSSVNAPDPEYQGMMLPEDLSDIILIPHEGGLAIPVNENDGEDFSDIPDEGLTGS